MLPYSLCTPPFRTKSRDACADKSLGKYTHGTATFAHSSRICAFMAGVLWLVQIVHYPLLGAVSGNEATDIAIRHQTLITRSLGRDGD